MQRALHEHVVAGTEKVQVSKGIIDRLARIQFINDRKQCVVIHQVSGQPDDQFLANSRIIQAAVAYLGDLVPSQSTELKMVQESARTVDHEPGYPIDIIHRRNEHLHAIAGDTIHQ